MSKYGLWSCALVLALGLLGCRRADIRVASIYVPGLGGAECAEPVLTALVRGGVRPGDIQVSLETRTVVIRYDSMGLALKNLEHAIAAAGFEANGVPPDGAAQAALPESCR